MAESCSSCHSSFATFGGDAPRERFAVCEPCSSRFEKQARHMHLGQYLDDFEVPVMVVDSDGRILAANDRMTTMLGRPQKSVRGLLGGEAMECAYARLPGGCGKTIHCETCAIRRAVELTRDTGEPQVRVPVRVDRDDGPLAMEVTTKRVGPAVFVTIPADAA